MELPLEKLISGGITYWSTRLQWKEGHVSLLSREIGLKIVENGATVLKTSCQEVQWYVPS